MIFKEVEFEKLESQLREKQNWEIDHARIWLAKQYLQIDGIKIKFRIPSRYLELLSGEGKIKISITPYEIMSERNEIIMWSDMTISSVVSLIGKVFLKKAQV